MTNNKEQNELKDFEKRQFLKAVAKGGFTTAVLQPALCGPMKP